MIQIPVIEDECYPIDYFENQDLEAILCPLGLGIVNNPVFDPCGHVFCRACIMKCLNKKNECPMNKQILTLDRLIPALSLKNLVMNLQLKQCFKSCGWSGKLEQYLKHELNECPEVIIGCLNSQCQEKILRKYLNQHLQICLFKLCKCQYCERNFIFSELEKHQEICDQKQVQCDQCNQNIQIFLLQSHKTNDCQERSIKCQIENCGQTFKFKDGEQLHIQSDYKHITLLQNQLNQLKQVIQQQNQKISYLEQLIDVHNKQNIPYLEGWKLSLNKTVGSREWTSINSIQKVGTYFSIKFQVTGLQARSNSWRAIIGIQSTRLYKLLWYKQEKTYVYVLGGLKCAGQETPEPYGKEIEGDFNLTMTVNRQCQLVYDFNQESFGPAFTIPKNIVEEGFYIVISLINAGKVRIIKFDHL